MLEMKSPKVVGGLLAEGFNLIGAGRGRLVFGKLATGHTLIVHQDL